jgi:hypothetical protein
MIGLAQPNDEGKATPMGLLRKTRLEVNLLELTQLYDALSYKIDNETDELYVLMYRKYDYVLRDEIGAIAKDLEVLIEKTKSKKGKNVA